jgi:hypothetical protein
MKNDIIFDKIFLSFIISIILTSSIKGQNSRCLYLLSESEVYNFYYLKSDYNENKYI